MNKKIILMSAIFLISNIFAMESDLAIKSLQGNTLAWYLVCNKSSKHTISSFASTDSQNNQLVKHLTQQNKKFLPKLREGCQGTELWLLYNRACCFAYQPLEIPSTGKLKLVYHQIKNDSVQSIVRCFEHFISFLPDNPAPFFLQKKIYFYARGNYQAIRGFDSRKIELRSGLVRYGLDGSITACFLDIGKDASPINLSTFLLYKPLFQAILKSNPEETEGSPERGYVVKSLLYSLNNVVIPQEYKEKSSSFKEKNDPCIAIDFPFDELPSFMKEPIEKRYTEQQHNKDI